MQSFFGMAEEGAAFFVDILLSFQVEVCMLGVAMLCFKFLHRGFAKSSQQQKESISPAKQTKRETPPTALPSEPPKRDYAEEIKACNAEGARRLWSEMVASGVQPGEGTLTGMVEVLVAEGCAEEGWELADRVWRDSFGQPYSFGQPRVQVCSALLRGFSKAGRHARVYQLYSAMRERKIPINTITFNIILNSLLHLGQMQEIPQFLEAMKAEGPRGAPDIVTFATIVKGYCQAGEVDVALTLLDRMMAMNIKPDEFMFNSLLDGCAKNHRVKQGLRLLDLMHQERVKPSNYTLSIAMKLLGRAHRLSQAFDMCEGAQEAYGFRPNIQVYTCLMQACFQSRRIRKAFDLYNKIVEERLAPIDAKTYTVLALGCLHVGAFHKAAMVVRTAYHVPCAEGLVVSEGLPKGVSRECFSKVLSALKRECPADAERLEVELAACPSPPSPSYWVAVWAS